VLDDLLGHVGFLHAVELILLRVRIPAQLSIILAIECWLVVWAVPVGKDDCVLCLVFMHNILEIHIE